MTSAVAFLPQGFKLRREQGTLSVSWKGPTHWILVVAGVLGLLLNGLLLNGFLQASQGLTGAPFLAGAGLLFSAYLLLVGLCNRTTICVSQGQLRASNGPLPCLLPRVFQVACRQGFRVKEVEELRVEAEQGEETTTYALWADARGDATKLLTRLELEEARWLGRVIAESAGLEVILPEPVVEGAVCRLRRRLPRSPG